MISKSPASRSPLNQRGLKITGWSFVPENLHKKYLHQKIYPHETWSFLQAKSLFTTGHENYKLTISEKTANLIIFDSPVQSPTLVETPCKQESLQCEGRRHLQMKLHRSRNLFCQLYLTSPLLCSLKFCKQSFSEQWSMRIKPLSTDSEKSADKVNLDSWGSPFA
jgi:hypothetical protein